MNAPAELPAITSYSTSALSAKKQRIISFLVRGLSHTQVASIIGCSPAYISQMVKEPEFAQELESAAASYAPSEEATAEEEAISAKYLSLEHEILKQIGSQIGSADLRDATRALEVVSARQEKRAERLSREKHPAAGSHTSNIAVLVLPHRVSSALQAAPEVQINAQGEIIAVGDQSMAPMASTAVRDLFNQFKVQDKVAKLLDSVPEDF